MCVSLFPEAISLNYTNEFRKHFEATTYLREHAVEQLVAALRYKAGRSRVRFPIVSIEFFIEIILPAALWPWGRLSL